MAEEIVQPVAPQTPPTPPAPNTIDPVKMAEELGELRKVKEDYEEYKNKVTPVLETLYSDSELLEKAQISHKKRLGQSVPETPPAPTSPTTPTTPTDPDQRMATVGIIQNDFEKNRGIDKLPKEKQAELRGQIGNLVKEMLDPRGNKSITQVFEEVSLVKLPWYLDRAMDLLSKEDEKEAAYQRGKSEVLSQYEGDRGSIGSMDSSSISPDQIVLSQKEKETARKMGISEDAYLKNKKTIAQMNS